ncbi:hypothetical protein [Thalassolituus hydrocarboniclasticus]|uniref:Uncharacterized protein n=1 Tax=Thalassolituus hydrocarboniclasticus TaxID=2742796 RepID=A0ABY6A890_9GAMM|nr:hypothetical protein [Thalassolituus hydrocarboniclasticus]UXD87169.1 hypothetical protein HUF19_06830 [Thalassolituus hydrocarboniclasticus]
MLHLKDIFDIDEDKTSGKHLFLLALATGTGSYLAYFITTETDAMRLINSDAIYTFILVTIFFTGFTVGALIARLFINTLTLICDIVEWLIKKYNQVSKNKKEKLSQLEKGVIILENFSRALPHLTDVEKEVVLHMATEGDIRLPDYDPDVKGMLHAKLIARKFQLNSNESLYGLPSPSHSEIVNKYFQEEGIVIK